jgi:SAM-dependent methyltransferase
MNPPPAFPDHFSAAAKAYRHHRPDYPQALVDWLAREAPGQDRAWDAGCGSGQLALLLASRFRRVVASDASRQQVAAAPRHPRVAYRVATAEAPGLPPASMDLVVAAQAAHWFDLDAYYRTVARVTRPGGLVALVSYGVLRLDAGLDDLMREFHDVVLAPHWPPERAAVVSGYRTLPFPFPELSPPEMEIRRRWTLPQLLGYVATWSGVRPLALPDWARFQEALGKAWGPPDRPREVRWPLAVRAGRVGKGHQGSPSRLSHVPP